MKYNSLNVNIQNCRLILFSFLLFCFIENALFKSHQSGNQIENIMIDYVSNTLGTLSSSKVLSMKRYKINVNYNKIKLSMPPFKNEEIKLQDIIILKENTIFFNSLQSINKLMSNQSRTQQLHVVMSKLKSNSYSNTNNCRLFFSFYNSNKNNFLNLKLIQLSKKNEKQKNLNIMCFSNRDHASTFDKVFEKIYENFLKQVNNINNMNFYDNNINKKLFIPSKIDINSFVSDGQELNPGQLKFINLDKSKAIFTTKDNKGSKKFSFEIENIIDCEVKTIEKAKLLCVVFKLGKDSKITKNIRICPNHSNYLKKLIDYVYIKLYLANTCQNKINKTLNDFLKSGEDVKSIITKFKPFSPELIKNKLQTQIGQMLNQFKDSTGKLKKDLEKILKKLATSAKEIIDNLKDKNKGFAKLIDKLIKDVKQRNNNKNDKSDEEKDKKNAKEKKSEKDNGKDDKKDGKSQNSDNKKNPDSKRNKNKENKSDKKNKYSKDKEKNKSSKNNANNDNRKSDKMKKKSDVEGNKNKNKNKEENKNNKSDSQLNPKKLEETNNNILNNKKSKVNKKNEEIKKSMNNSPINSESKLRVNEEHIGKFGEEIDNLYKKNLKNINMDLLFQKYNNYFNPNNESNRNKDNSFNNSNGQLNSYNNPNSNRIVLFQSNLPIGLKPLPLSSSFFTPKSAMCSGKPNPPVLDVCDKNDIYCLCKNHPQYKECVCAAYPKSVVCMKNYCIDHPNQYECNPLRCEKEKDDNCEDCFCKNHVNDIKCKCKTNPYSKDCFCTQNPLSHLCNMKACQFNPNSLFCACRTNLRPDMCEPSYCVENPLNAYCKCIVNPGKDDCRCLNDPLSCSKNEFTEAIVEYDLKIRDACVGNKLYYTFNPYQHNNFNNQTNYIVYDKSVDPTLIDPKAVYNMYYPPCRYDPDNPNSLPNDPCIPFPEPPKPCNSTHANDIKSKFYLDSDGLSPCFDKGKGCIHGLTNQIGSNIVQNLSTGDQNQNNFKNLMTHQNNPDTLMLYNKWLLFNTNCILKGKKEKFLPIR